VYSCPVNCIQPTPDDPAFETTEMLFIDPVTCVDCGACVSACPVEAIKPHSKLSPGEQLFQTINAAYHREPRSRPPLAPVRPALTVRDRGEPLRVAIVGSGPAAMYAADEVLTIPGARVSMYERLPVPYGLVRSGVAPDHRRTRRMARQLDEIARQPGLTMHLGVEVGRDIGHQELASTHHAVIYGVGAGSDRRLEIPGAKLPGVASATDFVAWYNGHPDHAGRVFNLSHRRAVVIGNGNVALDVARILTIDPQALLGSDISPAALAALRASRIEEVLVLGRRGPAQSAFTLPELVGLSSTPGVELLVDADLAAEPAGDPKIELMRRLGPPGQGARRITLRYLRSARRIHGTARVEAIELELGALRAIVGEEPAIEPTGRRETIPAGLVLTSIGYRAIAIPGLPFDEGTGTVPNHDGRVIDPGSGAAVAGTYVVGWIKRGPSGFIGTNKACSQDTVRSLVEDFNAGALTTSAPHPAERRTHLLSRQRPSLRARSTARR
jgi:ferredoxin--NADP+ reductase